MRLPRLGTEILLVLDVLNTAQRAKQVSGAVAEIGVHHGKLFIGLRLLQRPGDKSVAIDIFGDWIDGEVRADPLYDPKGERIRA